MNEIIIKAKPIAKARARKGKYGNFYTPNETKRFETLVGWNYKLSGYERYEKAVKLEIDFYVKKPIKCKRKYPTIKPDIDNQIKSILDGLNGIAYHDDKQVVDIKASKFYADEDYVKIRIEEKAN